MRASLDTSVIIHVYRANLQRIFFEFFRDGVIIYEQIRKVELEHHGQDVLALVDCDISKGNIVVYTDEMLKAQAVFRIFQNHVRENRLLYGSGDLGEIYAISLAQTLGTYVLVTDDIKQGGPYMSLLQLEYEIMPFTFADILILRYLIGDTEEKETLCDFEAINQASELGWSMKSQLAKFIKRFWSDPYKEEERRWMASMVGKMGISVKTKFSKLRKLLS